MVTKAGKLKAKRAGRKKVLNVPREPNGRISRAYVKEDIMSVVKEARLRHHGIEIPKDSANDDKKDGVKKKDIRVLSGYTLGRMYLDGSITDEQLEAGNRYAETMTRYYSAVGIPFPSARAQSLFSIRGHDGDVTEQIAARARKAADAMMALEGVLLQQTDGPQVKGTTFNVCVMDYDHLRSMSGQQLLWLKRGLNAIKDHSGLQES